MKIKYTNDVTLNEQVVQGSDGRLNVSARSDGRGYYNARDKGQTYSVQFSATHANTEFVAYWKNNRTDGKHLVIQSAHMSGNNSGKFSLNFVTGTAAGGSDITPTNLNKTSSEAAPTGSARGNGSITGLTVDSVVDVAGIPANGHEEFQLKDQVRLGQNDAIAIKYDLGEASIIYGTIFGFYE